MNSRTRLWILIFALAGVFFAGSSTWVHYRILTDPTYTSPCDINASFNCSQVYLSSYGSAFGVPVAIWGLAWFALVGLIAAFARPSSGRLAPSGREPTAATYVFALSVLGLGAILYFAYASFFVLRTGCVLCIGTYVSVLGIFIVSGASSSSGLARVPSRLPGDVRALFAAPTTFLVAILYLAFTASAVAFFPREGTPGQAAAQSPPPSQDAEAAFAAAWAQQPRVDLGIDPEGASVVIVKFIDWQCPSCKMAHFTYKPVLDKYAESHPGAVKEVIKDFPLSNTCNFSMSTLMHQSACQAAALVRLARDQGKAAEVVDWFFTVPDQQAVTPQEVEEQARRRLGIEDFDRAYREKLPDIQRDIADAVALEVRSTPTYFINGIRAQTAQGWLSAPYFDLAIKLELDRAEVGK